MTAFPLLALAIQLSFATKVVAALLLVGGYSLVKYKASQDAERERLLSDPDYLKNQRQQRPQTVEFSAPSISVSSPRPATLKVWMDHWRPLMEYAIARQDLRQIELLNLMMATRTEGDIIEDDEVEPEENVTNDSTA